MKYNKFLIALAFGMGISANTSYCAESPTSWSDLGYQGYSALTSAPKAVYKGLKYVVGGLGGSAINIPSSILNAMGEWSLKKTIMVVVAGIGLLVASYGPEKTLKLVTGVVENAPESHQPPVLVSSALQESGELSRKTRQGSSGIRLKKLSSIPSWKEILLKNKEESWVDFFNRFQKSEYGKTLYGDSVKDENEALEAFKLIMVNILKKSLPTLTEIGNLQRVYSLDPVGLNLFNSALQDFYKDQYRSLVGSQPAMNKEEYIVKTMSDVENDSSDKRHVLLSEEYVRKGIEIPTEYNGLNWGKGGLRYLALKSLLDEMRAKNLSLRNFV